MKNFITSLLVMSLTMPALAQQAPQKSFSEGLQELGQSTIENSEKLNEFVTTNLVYAKDAGALVALLGKYGLAYARIMSTLGARSLLGGDGKVTNRLSAAGPILVDAAVAGSMFVGSIKVGNASINYFGRKGWGKNFYGQDRFFYEGFEKKGVKALLSRGLCSLSVISTVLGATAAVVTFGVLVVDDVTKIKIERSELEKLAESYFIQMKEIESQLAALEQN